MTVHGRGTESGTEEQKGAGKERRRGEEEGKRLSPNGPPFTVSAMKEAVLSTETTYNLSEPSWLLWRPEGSRRRQEARARPAAP